jgi:hypothetical protein
MMSKEMKCHRTKQRQRRTPPPPPNSWSEPVHQDRMQKDYHVDYYTTPQKLTPQVLMDSTMLYPGTITPPSNNFWKMVPPSAPVKATPRSSRIPFPQHVFPCPVVSSFQLPPKTPPLLSLASSTSPNMGQNPISPAGPFRPSRDKSTTGFEMEIEYDDEEPSELLVMKNNPFPTNQFIYERVGMPHLRVFRVKLPPSLIDTLDSIIDGAEQHAQSLRKGWKTELYSLTKCDVACRDIPGIRKYVRPILDFTCHAIHALYGVPKLMVDKNQPHVLKYSAEMNHTGGRQFMYYIVSIWEGMFDACPFSSLQFTLVSLMLVELHHDRCDVTANLLLSSNHDFKGGGTMIPDAAQVVMLQKGEVLLHPGSLVHGGMDITEGTRFLLVTFAHFQ